MKAMQITEYGGPEVLKYVDLPDPVAADGQAVVDIQAVGVNFTDIYSRQGVNPPGLPWVAGVEAAGVVRSVGSGVSNVPSAMKSPTAVSRDPMPSGRPYPPGVSSKCPTASRSRTAQRPCCRA